MNRFPDEARHINQTLSLSLPFAFHNPLHSKIQTLISSATITTFI